MDIDIKLIVKKDFFFLFSTENVACNNEDLCSDGDFEKKLLAWTYILLLLTIFA